MMECKHLHKQWQNLNYPVNILSLIIAFGLILAQYIAWVKIIDFFMPKNH